MSTSSLDRTLRRLGDEPVPAPDAAFAAALEDRLRTVSHLQATEPAGLPQRPANRRRPGARKTAWLRPLAAGVAALTVFAAVALARPGDDDTLRVAAANNSMVVLPDGTVDAATPGLLVPDGTKILTGDGGHVVAGDVELGPNRSGLVDGGVIHPASGDAIPPTPKPAFPVTPTSAPTPTTARPPVGDPPTPDPGAPTPAPTAPHQPTDPDGREPATPVTTATKPAATTDPKPTPTTTAAVRNPPVTLKLEAAFIDTTVRLRWSAYSGADFEAYLVLRADAPAEPGYPVDEKTTVVARITSQSQTEYFDSVKDPAARSYRIVAVDRDRRVIGASPAVRPVAKTSPTGTTAPTE